MSVARDKLAARVAPAALVALTLTALAPYAPYCDWLGDEGAWLWGAENLLGGRHFRIGMFALNPLIYLVTAGWMEVFGRSFLSIRALCAAVVVGIALGIYATALRLGVRRSVALGVSSLWVLLTQGNWTTVSHHWLSALFAISALCAAVTPVAVIETQVGRAEAATGRAPWGPRFVVFVHEVRCAYEAEATLPAASSRSGNHRRSVSYNRSGSTGFPTKSVIPAAKHAF